MHIRKFRRIFFEFCCLAAIKKLLHLLIIVVILISIAFFLGKYTTQVTAEKENFKIRQINAELDTEYNLKRDKIRQVDFDLAATREKFHQCELEGQRKIDSIQQEIVNSENSMATKLDKIKDFRFAKITAAATEYRKKQLNQINTEIDLAAKQFAERKTELDKVYNQLENSIIELRTTRDALIEANRREEELKLQQDYYKILLDAKALNDIHLLKSIEHQLCNKDSLYKLIWTEFYSYPTKNTLNQIIGKEKASGIYKITNQTNGKIYIGQSVDLHTRLTNHIKAAIGIGTIAHQTVHDAMAAEGIENFTFEILEKCDKSQLNKKEKLWIETYASDKYGYNRTSGGSSTQS